MEEREGEESLGEAGGSEKERGVEVGRGGRVRERWGVEGKRE